MGRTASHGKLPCQGDKTDTLGSFKYVWQHKSSHNINIDQICPHLMNDNLHQYSYKGAFLDSLGRDYYVIGTASDIQVNTQYLKVSNQSWRIHRTFRLPDECRPHQSDCVHIVDSKRRVNSKIFLFSPDNINPKDISNLYQKSKS